MNKVIYTALFGDYDDLIELKKFEGWDYICFTDQNNLKSDVWKIIEVNDDNIPPNMLNRMYKWLPHRYLSEYELSFYIDTNLELLKNPDYFLDTYLNDYLLAIPSHGANCIYKESNSCVLLGKSKAKDTLNQIKTYHQDSFPENFGLGANGIMFRFHNDPRIIKLMENVWNNLLTYNTKRDQLTLMYEIWKLDFKRYALMRERVADKDFFRRKKHKNKINRSLYQRLVGNINKLIAKKESKKYKKLLDNLMKNS